MPSGDLSQSFFTSPPFHTAFFLCRYCCLCTLNLTNPLDIYRPQDSRYRVNVPSLYELW